MKLLISSILLLFLAPCNSEQKISSSTEDYSKTTIIYEQTPCYGTCPVYRMTLDGATMLATYTGTEHTEKMGTYTKPISNTEYSRFMEVLDKANFNNLNDEYMGRVPDFSIREITLTKNGKTKKVRNRSEGPKELEEVEKVFKSFANSDGWKKTETGN